MKESGADLNGILTLLTIVRAGSFSAAARQLGIPVNRLSREITRLEDKLGVRLLQRTTRKLSLTTVGQTLLDRAGPAMQELESWWQEAQAQADEPRGHVRVSTHIDFLSVVSIEYLTRFMQQYPAITLEVVLSDDQVDLLATGIDLAFRAGPIHDEGLVARQLFSSRLYVVASPRLIERYGMPADIAALASYPSLARHSKDGWTSWSLSNGQHSESVRIPVRLTVNGLGALVAGAKAGLGIALLPDHLVLPEMMAGSLVNLLPEYHHDSGGLYVVYPSRKNLPAAVRVLIAFIMDIAESTPAALLRQGDREEYDASNERDACQH